MTKYVNGIPYSKTEILKRCSDILRKTPINAFVNAEDFGFLMGVFCQHPYWETKTLGRQIVGIMKMPSGNYGSSCFWLVRDDDTITDISFRKVFEEDKVTADVLEALRYAVRPDIEAFRSTFEPFEYNGRTINNLSEVEVDHYDKKFREVAALWIAMKGGVDNLYPYVSDVEDGSTSTTFTDESLVMSFRRFHAANTHLRFLPKDVNRQLG